MANKKLDPEKFRDTDGRYRYICEAGHRTVTSSATYPVCKARAQTVATVHGPECGADIEYRIIPYG